MTKSDMDQNGYRLKKILKNLTRMTEWVSLFFFFFFLSI